MLSIDGGFIYGGSYDNQGMANYSLALTSVEPTEDDFKQTNIFWPGVNSPLPKGKFGVGPLNFTDIPGVTNGTNATIRIAFNNGTMNSYQCFDVVSQSHYLLHNNFFMPYRLLSNTLHLKLVSPSKNQVPFV